jgi:hypothetical protein
LQNIGFDNAGNLNINQINSFLSGSNGFVRSWYIQGTTQSFIQTNNNLQAQLILEDKPSLSFTGTQFYIAALKTNGGNYSYQVVCDPLFNISSQRFTILGENNGTNNSYGTHLSLVMPNYVISFGHFKNIPSNFDEVQAANSFSLNTRFAFAAIRTNSQSHAIYKNNIQIASAPCSNVITSSTNNLKLGDDYYDSGSRFFIGKIHEIIFDLDNAWTNSQLQDLNNWVNLKWL